MDILEIVVRRGDRHAHAHVDEGEQADSGASPHGQVLPARQIQKTRPEMNVRGFKTLIHAQG